TEGPHKDTPELRLGAFRWMNRWLKGETGPVTEAKHDPLPPEELKVVERIPEGAVNATVHEVFRKPASFETPRSPEVARQWWDAKKSMLTQALREKVFRGWEDSPPDLNARRAGDRSVGDVRLRAYDFVSEEGIELRLWLVTAAGVEKP